jgi:hypothetical protein
MFSKPDLFQTRHAGRTTISTDDVMLLARRNEGLAALLRNSLDNIEAGKGGGKGRSGK